MFYSIYIEWYTIKRKTNLLEMYITVTERVIIIIILNLFYVIFHIL